MKLVTLYQYVIVSKIGEVIPGCNANKEKESIEFFEGMMNESFKFDNQSDYKCIKVKLELPK